MYKELIQKDIDALEIQKSSSIKKNNILKIVENIGAIFTGTYLHYGEMPKEIIFERNIAESVKLRRKRIAEIEKREKNIDNELLKSYFTNYQSPSDMYKKLRKTKGERNKDRLYVIKKVLNKMKRIIENVPENKIFKIEENEKIINIIEHILYFNQLQSGHGLKILTPNQMLSRLPLSFAQLKAGNNSEKLKKEIRQFSYSLYRSKKLTKQFYKSLIDII